jgi:ubiquinone/menaquinone biosynthesis C-methylase UbiE
MENALNADFLEAIRLSELTQIETILKNTVPAGAKILEIGAGTGWQARELAARGYVVSAIDIPTSNHGQARIWSIIDFDGRFIPFPDNSFDIVYSSNVLEHVEDIKTLNTEIARVLRIGGTAIHYVPTSAWRAWSLAAFYPALLRDVLRRMRSKLGLGRADSAAPAISTAPSSSTDQRSLVAKILRRIVPHAHGAVGSCFSELLRFNRRSWDDFFSASGWAIASYSLNGLFLTGDMILGARLSTERRKRLSHLFGSTAHLYVLKRQPAQ